jgi:hypothetical protein
MKASPQMRNAWLVGAACLSAWVICLCGPQAWAAEPLVQADQEVDNRSGLDGFFIGLEGAASIPGNFKYIQQEQTGDIGLKGGYRINGWGIFGQVGYNTWVSLVEGETSSPSALNVGLGTEVLFFEGRARFSLASGPSIYLTDSSGEAGEVGFFIDLRPVGFRFPIADSWTIGVDPLAFNFVVPVLTNIPLVVFKYISVISLEYTDMPEQRMPAQLKHDKEIGIFLQTSLHFSLLSDDPERSMLADTFGFGLRAGYRFNDWAIFMQIENNRWFTSELSAASLVAGVLDVGLGCEYLFFEGRARTSLALGSSTLLMDTFLLDKGEVGIFFEVRPLGLRWAIGDYLYIVFDPLTFALVAPDPGDEGLVLMQYRTLLGLEIDL